MEQLTPQIKYALSRFPKFELSYETISHTKVYTDYDIGMAIPHGKKGYIWFTYDKYHDVCYILEVNREKRIVRGGRLNMKFDTELSIGTLLYGTIISDENNIQKEFIIEDILTYKGIGLDKSNQLNKLSFISKFLANVVNNSSNGIHFHVPAIWKVDLTENDKNYPCILPDKYNNDLSYTIHHIQYRSSLTKMPLVNVFIPRKGMVVSLPSQPTIPVQKYLFDQTPIKMTIAKPQYKYPTIFQVTADIQYDIYHLFAYGKNNQRVYYNVAYIPNYEISVLLNGVFRKIRENTNLDYIEESDDEDDFQNMDEDKYVDMNKTVLFECIFNRKFKKWVPMRIMDRRSKVVHISKL